MFIPILHSRFRVNLVDTFFGWSVGVDVWFDGNTAIVPFAGERDDEVYEEPMISSAIQNVCTGMYASRRNELANLLMTHRQHFVLSISDIDVAEPPLSQMSAHVFRASCDAHDRDVNISAQRAP
eukprot:GHVU01056583.1.p1 GENE.GHVU01056583.1~~GHVU01056583.1.p1  ORF type:complete len:124 (+),score=0.69 GHVU01056583.1:510-881(+)